MNRLLTHVGTGLVFEIIIPFFLVFFIMFSMDSFSDELNQSQKEFSDSIESYNNLRAEIIVEQAKNEAQSQQNNKNIEIGTAWQEYFPYNSRNTQNIRGIEEGEYTSFIEFLRYSYYRPRDIITMLEFLQKNVEPGRTKFKKSDFDDKTFSNNYSYYVLGEIKDQLLFYYQLDEYETFLKFFEFLNGKVAFNYSEYLQIFDKYISYI
ncbi:MAG: hypothetical protein KAI07_07480, partial [Deltaproteobacteria bacterium]|nr:hypothetical protein [Deltaproteobacteria bacterium]